MRRDARRSGVLALALTAAASLAAGAARAQLIADTGLPPSPPSPPPPPANVTGFARFLGPLTSGPGANCTIMNSQDSQVRCACAA